MYDKRLQYQEYDVTHLLHKGKNVLEVLVGEGWYRGVFRNMKSDEERNNFGKEAGLLCKLELAPNDHDNQETVITTDTSWRCAESPIRYAELYDGELQDTRYQHGNWKPVKLLDAPKGILTPSLAEPVRQQEVIKPKQLFQTPKGEQVVDFGQNIAGWVQVTLRGKAGDTIKLSHAEILDSAGNFYTGNLRSAKAADIYILNGKRQVLKPHFTYHGFRYVKVEGAKLSNGDFRAVALYSDLKKVGRFSCSDPMINQLQSNINWSMKSNFVDIPSDCPQRSERLAWTADAQVFCGTASFLRDTKCFYQKWLADAAMEQRSNGAVPNFVPTSSSLDIPINGVAGWGDAVTIMPWTLFEVYGDTIMLREQYPMMKRWVDYINSVSINGIWMNKGYGDWYAMGDSTSIPLINQCFYAHSTSLLLRAAKVLRKTEDLASYNELLKQIKDRFMATYGKFDTKASSTQTAYALALAFELLPAEQRQTIANRLAENVRGNGGKLATGFLGTPYLLSSLSNFGHTELAYALLMQKACPSWLYPITKGASTIWERWDAIMPKGSVQATSFNHYAYGAVGQWMYENIAGIKPASPGYEQIIIKPLIGGGLTWAKGSYLSKYGKIAVSWKLKHKAVLLDVEIPQGTRAEVWVPGEKDLRKLGAGRYHFQSNL